MTSFADVERPDIIRSYSVRSDNDWGLAAQINIGKGMTDFFANLYDLERIVLVLCNPDNPREKTYNVLGVCGKILANCPIPDVCIDERRLPFASRR